MTIVRENKFSENVLTSGTSTINTLTTVTVTTQTRNAGEVFVPKGFVTNNVDNAAWGESAVALALSDAIGMFLSRTANANEFSMNIRNTNATNTRTIDWSLIKSFPKY